MSRPIFFLRWAVNRKVSGWSGSVLVFLRDGVLCVGGDGLRGWRGTGLDGGITRCDFIRDGVDLLVGVAVLRESDELVAFGVPEFEFEAAVDVCGP